MKMKQRAQPLYKRIKDKIPEPFIGIVMHVESTEKFYVHKVSNDGLFDEAWFSF